MPSPDNGFQSSSACHLAAQRASAWNTPHQPKCNPHGSVALSSALSTCPTLLTQAVAGSACKVCHHQLLETSGVSEGTQGHRLSRGDCQPTLSHWQNCSLIVLGLTAQLHLSNHEVQLTGCCLGSLAARPLPTRSNRTTGRGPRFKLLSHPLSCILPLPKAGIQGSPVSNEESSRCLKDLW